MRSAWLAVLLGAVLQGAPAEVLVGDVVPWQDLFQRVAGPRWVDRAAQVQAESRFDPLAVSPVGAIGCAQWMSSSWKDAIRRGWAPSGSDPRDPYVAIPAQHQYMLWNEAFLGGFEAGLGGYNAGAGNIRKAQRLAVSLGIPGERAWLVALPKVTGTAHAKETRGYILNNERNRNRIWFLYTRMEGVVNAQPKPGTANAEVR
jgi:hypothetical protein